MLAARILRSIAKRFVRACKCRDGIAATELALIAPVLLSLSLVGSEMFLFMRTHFQAAQMASTVADVISRYQVVTSSDVSAILTVSAEVMGVKTFNASGKVILSSVTTDATSQAKVAWQCSAGNLGALSRVGAAGRSAILPAGLALGKDDNVIVAEVFYRYSQLLGWFSPDMTLVYKTAVFRPRLGSLATAPGC